MHVNMHQHFLGYPGSAMQTLQRHTALPQHPPLAIMASANGTNGRLIHLTPTYTCNANKANTDKQSSSSSRSRSPGSGPSNISHHHHQLDLGPGLSPDPANSKMLAETVQAVLLTACKLIARTTPPPPKSDST